MRCTTELRTRCWTRGPAIAILDALSSPPNQSSLGLQTFLPRTRTVTIRLFACGHCAKKSEVAHGLLLRALLHRVAPLWSEARFRRTDAIEAASADLNAAALRVSRQAAPVRRRL